MHVINIRWEGSYSPKEASSRPGNEIALYQVYQLHPVYGVTLVYIGRTHSSVGARIVAEGWESSDDTDPEATKIYIGHVLGPELPGGKTHQEVINIAEALLIHAHGPAYNSHYIFHPPSPDMVGEWIVRSFGTSRLLHREVSGLVWSKAAETAKKLERYRIQQQILETQI